MFVPSPEAPVPAEAGIRGLCLSLNSPVVHVDGLPRAPARAALGCFDEGGRLALWIALRSVEADRRVFFRLDGDPGSDVSQMQRLAPAMAFGESMGFLFDDDLISTGRRDAREALLAWCELCGVEPASAEGPPVVELLLDDVVDAETDAPEPEPAHEPTEEVAVAPPPETIGARLLSKFRRLTSPVIASETSIEESDAPNEETIALKNPGVVGRLLACFVAITAPHPRN